jgi:hypothetical protein
VQNDPVEVGQQDLGAGVGVGRSDLDQPPASPGGDGPGRLGDAQLLGRPEGERSPESELATLRSAFGEWPAPIPEILNALTERDVMRHDLYDLAPPLPTYVTDHVALIGDSAHAMTPDLGRGACEALVDAVTLSDHLISIKDIPAALTAYDRARRRPTQRLAARPTGCPAWPALAACGACAMLWFGPPSPSDHRHEISHTINIMAATLP